MNRLATRLLGLAAIVCLAGCAANKEACCDPNAAHSAEKVAVINTVCPIGNDDFGSKERSKDLAREWNGKSIGFCCDHCVAKFEKMTPEKKAEVATAAAANKAL